MPPRPVLAPALLALAGSAATAQDRPTETVPTVEVVGVTPLPGLGTPLRDVPANVQVLRGSAIDRQHQGNLAAFLEQNATGVTQNASQGNPYQPDLNFRGFTASPLLGVPQGLSVFQDGVRINEPFGDAVNWDLLPTGAIDSIELVPGSNPVYGLNTLGGAVAIATRRGRTHPGATVQVDAGSFGHTGIQWQQGVADGPSDVFVAGELAHDNGWAQHNPSHIRRFFTRAGHRTGSRQLDATLTVAENSLSGTQTLPVSLAADPSRAYTYPDTNTNRLQFFTAQLSEDVTPQLLLSATAYYRRYQNRNVSSNVNGDYGEQDEDGRIDTVQAFNDRAGVDQYSAGLAVQATLSQPLAGLANQLVLGASFDAGRAGYTQESQPASFTNDRGTVPAGEFALATNAGTRNRYHGLFVSDTLELAGPWSLVLSARYNRAAVDIHDRTGDSPGLDGSHRFSRLNPAVGFTWHPHPGLTAYASFNEGLRAPTAMELTCADPGAPCKLPNAFLSDPPLKPVVARTFEAGARGRDGPLAWSGAVYRTELRDDIQFISSGTVASNAGYFRNVGTTRRQGLELGANGRFGRFSMTAGYAFLDATYRSGFSVNSPVNTTADGGQIAVSKGDRLPGLPRHSLKLRAAYAPNPQWDLAASLVAASAIHARGDENNQDARGQVPGYARVDLDARYAPAPRWELFARVDNLFDRRYATVGVLGLNAFTGPGGSFAGDRPAGEQFRGFAAPRTIAFGLRYAWP
jgi:outer membrane receptor protein involved in Fe transport